VPIPPIDPGQHTSADDADEGKYVAVTTNVIGPVAVVRCYDETLGHIADEHPEFRLFIPTLEHAVHDTIAAPTHVYQSNTDIHASGYKFVSTRHVRGESTLVVAVKAIEGTSSLLKTAYFTKEVTGNVLYAEDSGEIENG
jgi:hypothetical protein